MKGEQQQRRKDLEKRPNGRSQKLQGVNNPRANISTSYVSGKLSTLKAIQDFCPATFTQRVNKAKLFCSAPKLPSSHYRSILGSINSAQALQTEKLL